ncbi:hypothetical protein D3H65_16545 [Paraflavitalea soli]|uniref:Tail specific protease domain-containing protein n=1 Tax=Paraflavitalea soli TaxID=2315862 RepID=A0A3B7MR23_9BACT|nr:S41 family peptidase [Paraflavitalea soli]AXY75490.1 hypothetical protein D3H65_16545 [Paraflavitalea soli]
MEKSVVLVLLLCFCNPFLFGQSTQTFTPREMREDIDTLISFIETAHPNPYYRYPKTQFYKEAAAIKNKLNKPLDLIDFYLLAEPLLTRLEDGHTDFSIPMAAYNKKNPFVLPYKFRLSPDKPYIRCERAYRSITPELPDGALIISINDIPAKKIVDDVIRLNAGETRTFRAEFGGTNYFEFYLEKLYHANGLYKIRFSKGAAIHTITIKGIRQDVLNKQLQRYNDSVERVKPEHNTNYSLQLLPAEKAAIISFLEFDDLDECKVFIDSAFGILKSRGIEYLIIDIRENGGGDSDIGDELMQYIARQPFRQYDSVLEKHSQLLKQRLLAHRKNRTLDSADKAFLNKPNGVFNTTLYQNTPLRDNPLRFTGHLYLLTSPYTFSSAADFAQMFRHYQLGTIIGEETGGLIISYGDIVSASLPHTGLQITISSKLYYNVGSRKNDWKGVVPDKIIPSGKAMSLALKLIRQSKTVTGSN